MSLRWQRYSLNKLMQKMEGTEINSYDILGQIEQPSFRLSLSRVCYFAVLCLVGNGRSNLLLLDLLFEKVCFVCSFLKAPIQERVATAISVHAAVADPGATGHARCSQRSAQAGCEVR